MTAAGGVDADCRAVRDDLHDIGPAIAWAVERASAAGLAEEAHFGIEVCLEEALANLIVHGAALDGRKDIVLAIVADPSKATIEITDRCTPFDAAHAAPPARDGAQVMLEGGRGLRLMHAFATDLSYTSDEGRNRLTMSFRAPEGDTPGP